MNREIDWDAEIAKLQEQKQATIKAARDAERKRKEDAALAAGQELRTLVSLYNALEVQQKDLLERLFALLAAREGPRGVKFSGRGDNWNNCWPLLNEPGYDHALLLRKQQVVDPMITMITAVEAFGVTV